MGLQERCRLLGDNGIAVGTTIGVIDLGGKVGAEGNGFNLVRIGLKCIVCLRCLGLFSKFL